MDLDRIDPLLLQSLVERARVAWPGIDHPAERFFAHLAGKVSDPIALESLHTDDLYLACACTDGSARAIQAFDERCLSAVDRAVSRMRAGSEVVAEVKQIVRKIVLVAEPGRTPRIADYSGRSSLRVWLRVIAMREAVRLVRRDQREGVTADEDVFEALGEDAGPELRYFKKLYQAEFRAALREAVQRMSDRDRLILRQSVLDGVGIDRLGALYGVHRATAARWVASAREMLLEETKRALLGRLQVSPVELESILRLIQSQLHVSLRPLLDREGSS